MKSIIKKLVSLLDRIGKDKFEHFALGAMIATLGFIVATPLFRFMGHTAAFWVCFGISIAATLWLEVFKEFRVDVKPDWRDILATMLGGSMVWISLLVAY